MNWLLFIEIYKKLINIFEKQQMKNLIYGIICLSLLTVSFEL